MQQWNEGTAAEEPGAAEIGSEADLSLTSIEAHVLAQIVANGPMTAFEVMASYSRSPVAGLSGSPGAIYPIVKRLRARGLISAEADERSGRKAERLTGTEAGAVAARAWLASVQEADLLPHDPLRSKISFLGLLPKVEQMRFLLHAKRAVERKLREVTDYASAHSAPYADLAFDLAKANLEARSRWIDDILLKIAES